jgi:hypothetical protein
MRDPAAYGYMWRETMLQPEWINAANAEEDHDESSLLWMMMMRTRMLMKSNVLTFMLTSA